MPTYAYACKQCAHRFDAVQSFTDPALTECGECGGVLRKEYGSIGVTFNGSGFYRTDSRTPQGGTAAAKEGGSAEGSKEKGTTADTKGGPTNGGAKEGGSSAASTPAKTPTTTPA